MKRYEKSCGAIVYRNEQALEFLLIKSKAHSHWSFPKGHVEVNESEIETALREVYEETHLTISLLPGFRYKITYSPYKDTIKDVIYFIGQTSKDKLILQKEEIIESIWLSYQDALRIITFDTEKDLLTNAYEYIMKNT